MKKFFIMPIILCLCSISFGYNLTDEDFDKEYSKANISQLVSFENYNKMTNDNSIDTFTKAMKFLGVSEFDFRNSTNGQIVKLIYKKPDGVDYYKAAKADLVYINKLNETFVKIEADKKAKAEVAEEKKKIEAGKREARKKENTTRKKAETEEYFSIYENNDETVKLGFIDFPHPWYMTQVGNSILSEWEKRKPKGVDAYCVVSFSIQDDGSIKDLKIEKQSGSDAYNYAVKSVVEAIAPFSTFPKGFSKNEVAVKIEFKNGEVK